MAATYSDAELRAKAREVLPAGHFGNVGNGVVLASGEGGRVRDTSGRNSYIFIRTGKEQLMFHGVRRSEAAHVRQLLESTSSKKGRVQKTAPMSIASRPPTIDPTLLWDTARPLPICRA